MNLCEPEPNDSKRKHRLCSDETSMPALKLQRPNTPPSTPLPPLKITDLDYNCLEKIFVHLDLPTLLNVAAANAYLRPTAQYMYKRKFGQRMVCVTAVENCTPACSKLSVDDAIVIVFGLKKSLEYLRALGASIVHLSIMYRNADSKWSECIDLYVKTYCAESLETLALIEKTSGQPWRFVEKPFVSVRNVVIIKSDLTNQLASLPAWFPSLQTLELRDVRSHDRCIEQPFQHLLRLYIEVNNGTRCTGFTKREATDLLQLCPALISLEIHMPFARQGMTLKTLGTAIQHNHSIRRLKVSMERYWSCVTPTEAEQFMHEHPMLTNVSLENYKFTAETAIAILRQLNDLEVLNFQIKDSRELDAFAEQVDEQRWKFHWAFPIHFTDGCIMEAVKQQ